MKKRGPIATLINRCIWPVTMRSTRRYPRILAYHRFSVEPHERKMDLQTFREQLEVLRKSFRTLTFGELLKEEAWTRPHDPPLAVVTVDDGYADFYDIAWPALREAGVPATVFATVEFIEQRRWLWPDALEYLLFSAAPGRYEAITPLGVIRLDLTTPEARRATWDKLATRLLYENAERANVIADLERTLKARLPERPTEQYAAMTWEQLQEISAGGIEIGSHTMAHDFVAGLPPEHRRRDLVESKRLLQERLGKAVDSFAYPNGTPADAPDFLCREVQAAGYCGAAVCYPPSGAPGAPDRFRIERWPTASGDPVHFLNVMYGASLLLGRLRSRGASRPSLAPVSADG